ncbi:cell surface protein, partial [Latilactobacillus curvatus]|uniref:lectin-like domain-containing protein n=1 Tax=Latilactobacillus curvatus TaxID=28038 RepID=UPI00057568D6
NSAKTDTATTAATGDSAKADNIMASSVANNNLPSNTTVQASDQNPLIQLSSSSELNADSEALTNVTKDNFKDYFSLNGSAAYKDAYNPKTGILTITPDDNNQVGNFSLKSKIDMNTSFTLTGQINLGNRTSSQGGADGIGFAFHNGNTTDIGNAGGNLGIGGLQKAIGFKLDTYHNDYRTPQANEDGAQVASTDSNGYGWDTDPDGTKFPQFGAFVNTSQNLVQAQDGHYYSRWWAKTDMSSVLKLNSGDLDGQFHDFVVSYDGSNRKLTIKYTETGGNVLTWSTLVPDTYQAMAMVVSASTGGFKNLQQFKISSFDFKQVATVNVKYVDTKGNPIAQGEVTYPNGASVNGTYTTGQLEIPNYKFVRMDDGTATGAKSLQATGTLTKAGDNGTVIYVYAPYTHTSKTVNETIKYVDQNGKEVATGYTADPITFVTVTDPVAKTTTTYYSTTSKTITLDDNGVPIETGWTKADSNDFAKVVSPKVNGYKVISNDAPKSDLTSVAQQNVTADSDDLHYKVVYAPAYSASDLKQISETIHYVNEQGVSVAPDNTKASVSFVTITNPVDGSTKNFYSRTETSTPKLDNDGKPIGDWQEGNSAYFDSITNPTIKGYTPDQAQIDTITGITADSADIEKTVTYVANKEAAKVTYIDDKTGKTLSPKDLTGDYGSTDPYRTGDTIADYEKQGYQLVSDNYPTNGVVYNQDGTVQSFEVHLTHGTTPVGPNNPQTPGTPINPDNPDGPKWPEGTDKSSVTQTVIRTVNYLDKQTGKVVAKQITEQVTYNRTAIVDKVTGQIIGYSTTGGDTVDQTDGDKAWTAVDNKSDWDSVTSPDLSSKGYLAPDLATVAQQTVTPGDKDVTVNVYYDHDVVPVNPTNPQTPGTPINPDDPDSPKWPAGTDKNSLTTDVHQTIHYQYGDGSQAAPDKTDSTTFDHQVEVDKVTGKIVKDDG